MRRFFQDIDHRKTIFILGAMLALNSAAFIIPGIPGNMQDISQHAPSLKPPDLMFRYSPEYVFTFLSEIGAEGRLAYQKMHFIIDFSFPLIYGLLFFVACNYFAPPQIKCYCWLGFLPTIMDLGENFSHVFITHRYPTQFPHIALIAQFFTITKFLFIILCVLCVGYLILKDRSKTE